MTPKNHPEGHVLQAFFDGELKSAVAEEVSAHCQECETCQEELENLRQMSGLLQKSPTPELPRTVWHRVKPTRDTQPRFKPVFGLAACVAGIALGFLLGPIQTDQDTSSNDLAWSENVTVWDTGATSSLLGVYQTTSD